MNIYDFEVETIKGETKTLKEFAGNVIVIVNTASKCGFTPQYKDLQSIYEEYKEEGVTVLGFPCNQFMGQEPGKEEEIQQFCEMNYGVTFPLFSKVDVNGKNASPLFQYLSEKAPGALGIKAIKWNFTKFLIDRSGNVVKRYAPNTSPNEMKEDIRKLL